MKANLKKMISLCLVLVLLGAVVPKVNAANEFLVTGYTVVSPSSITKDSTAKITVKIHSVASVTDPTTVAPIFAANDSFSVGSVTCVAETASGLDYTLTFEGLKYTGVGNILSFAVMADGVKYALTTSVSACVPYVEPTYEPDYSTPEPTAAPRAVITYSGLPEILSSGETATVKIDVKNTGKTAMKAPILNFTVSDALLITDAKYTVALSDIKAGSTASVSVPIKAFGKVTAQKQSIDVAMSFDYYNNVSTVSGEASAHIIVPCKLTDGSVEEPTTGSKPVPIVILSGYSYGGASIAAGSEADLHFTFTNTSKSLAVENIVLKVTAGANLQLNGSSNTFYFENVAAGGSKSVTLPLKAVPTISGSTQDVGLSFSYEYVDNEQRRERTSEMNISVPLYQPDRFELSEPVVAYVGFVGEETSMTMDYVNKGKTEVSNVEATISGDVDSYNSFVRVGNIPSGKSGTIAFAVTPMLEGDNKATITVSYEDANGNVQERVFETTLNAMAMEPFDPGEWEEPPYPVEEESSFPWWIAAVALAVITIIVGVVVSKKKKKAKLAKEQALWDDWDDDEGAGKTIGTTEAKPLPETAGVTEEATK